MSGLRRTLAAVFAVAALLALAPAAGAAVVTDSFTGTDGTLLQGHVGETGATWTKHPNYPADLTLLTNRVWGPQWGMYLASGIPSGAEYDVSATLTVKSNAGAIGVVGRAAASGTDSLYLARYNAATGAWELVSCTSACTVLSSFAQTLTVGQTYALKLEIRNAQKKLYVDGVQRASSIDNGITAVGRAGIRQGPADSTTTTGYHLDNFSVDMPSATDTTITAGPSGVTNNASPSFSFTSTPAGGTFECKLDGPGAAVGTWAACTTPKAYSALAQGAYTFNVRATVGGSTDSTPATRAFTVDTAAPDTSITAGPSGPTNSTAPSFSFSSTETGSTFQCKLDGPGTTVGTWGSCTSPKAYSALAQGSYTFSARATDPAGNQDATAATRAFTVDTTAPDTTIDSGPTGTITVNSASFGFSSEAGATFECKLDGPGTTVGSWGACSSPKSYSSLANGSYTFSARAKDAATNTDPTPATRAFTVSVASSGCTQTLSPGANLDTAVSTAAAGSVICLTTGTYTSPSVGSSNGTAAARVTLTSATPSSPATLNGRFVLLGTASYIDVTHLKFTFSSTTDNTVTVTAPNNKIAYNDISGSSTTICATTNTWNGVVPDNTVFDHNLIHDCGDAANTDDQIHAQGIYVSSGANITVSNNWCWNVAARCYQIRGGTGGSWFNNVADNANWGYHFGDLTPSNTSAYNNINGPDIAPTYRYSTTPGTYGYGGALSVNMTGGGTGNSFSNNCLATGNSSINGSSSGLTVANNTVASVQFVDAANHNYTLAAGSPCQGYGAQGTPGP
jgi:hypothetical protein